MKKMKLLKQVMAILFLMCVFIQKAALACADSIPSRVASQDRYDSRLGESNSSVKLDKEDVKKFVDDYFQTNMKKWNVPGVAVAVVKDNEELYKEGYGVSDIEKGNPVDPEKTTFPAASVSKLFTATAIMQLYQDGKLDLNENIQTYLKDIVIHNPYKDAVTCQNLLTHTSGLDEQSELDGGTLDKNAIKSQKQYFEKHIPCVITEPNTICKYSNIGFNLLGYTIEKVSGKSYEDYVTENILKPLDMRRSSVRIEDEFLASGYEFNDGKYLKVPLAYQYTSGSSGILSTVTDMEHFMIMHLNNGKYKNNTILDTKTEQMIQKKQFSNNDVFDGMGEGFIRASRNGVQLLKHEGALPGYTTTMVLIPDQHFGIYVATNSLSGMIFDFEEAFLDHFFGTCNPTEEDNNSLFDDSKYIGTYRNYDGISESNISKIFASLDNSAQLKVTKTSNGKLKVMYYEMSKEMVETNLIYKSDGIFIREDGKGYITFHKNNNGNIDYAFNNISHQAYKKIGSMETMTTTIIVLLILLLVLLVSSIRILFRRIRKKQIENKKLWLVIGIVNIIYVIGFLGIFILESYMILNYDYRFIHAIFALLTLLLVAIALNISEMIGIGYGIIKKKFNRLTMVKLLVVLTTQIYFVILLAYFNMIGYHVY